MSGAWLMPVRELNNFNCVRCLLYVAKNFICVFRNSNLLYVGSSYCHGEWE